MILILIVRYCGRTTVKYVARNGCNTQTYTQSHSPYYCANSNWKCKLNSIGKNQIKKRYAFIYLNEESKNCVNAVSKSSTVLYECIQSSVVSLSLH